MFTIGLIINNCTAPQNIHLWEGVVEAAAQHRINAIIFSRGQHINMPMQEAIYDLPTRQRLDGLIVACTLPMADADLSLRRRFFRRYEHLPVVTYGTVLEDIPGIGVDNYQGMRDVVQHLILQHNASRLVFVQGRGNSQDKRVRFRAYGDVLAEHDIPFDPRLVVTTDEWQSGEHTVETIYRERGLYPDAIIANNDDTALEIMDALKRAGIRVPQDVAVAGFDNIEQSQVITPPLTTVSLRAHERGRKAVEVILNMIEGQTVPNRIHLSTHLIVRESCGCLTPTMLDTDHNPQYAQPAHVIAVAMPPLEKAPELAQQLTTSLQADINGEGGAFLKQLDYVLKEVAEAGWDIALLQNVVAKLRNLFPEHREHVEYLCHQAYLMIGERARRALAYRNWETEQRASNLYQLGQVLTATPEIAPMMHQLADRLPQHGISACYVAMYEGESARLLLAYDKRRSLRLIMDDQRFPAPQLIPRNLWPDDDCPRSYVIEPLFFQEEQLGYVIFEMGPQEGSIYETISKQLSSALKVALLMDSNYELYKEAVSAQEEAEKANHLKSQFLSVVSHEIRTPLALLIGLSEMLLHDGDASHLPETYRKDLAQIYFGAQQLDGLMRDVIDLTSSQMGHLRLVKKMLDMADILRTVAAAGRQMAQEKGLRWKEEIPSAPLTVLGDRTRLQQIVLNLVSNAIKFTSEGEVCLRADVSGKDIVVAVSDTGIGIPPAEQELIFNEFHQIQTTYGGLGLGLAICRQLVQMHGGEIYIDSEENKGSTFYFTLPLSQHRVEQASSRRDSVLLLTEQKGRATRLAAYLVECGFEVDVIEINSEDWNVSHAFTDSPGAIVLDFQPDWGWQIFATLKEDPRTQDIPILFYSLMSGQSAMLDLDYIAKPMGMSALTEALERRTISGSDPTILIVDDAPNILEMHANVVKRQLPDCRVLQAAHGQAALDILQSEKVDLVLLDLMMPDMDGFDVLEAMQARGYNIPVIVLTAQILTEDDMARLNAGVASVLGKGMFSEEETLAQIKRVLAQSKHLGDETRRIVRRTMAFIHQHYPEEITRRHLAAHVGVSEGHLTRCFRQQLGLTPVSYLNRFRINRAKALLDAGELNITEVASAVGFAQSSYFTRVFRREVGTTPSDYQRRLHVLY